MSLRRINIKSENSPYFDSCWSLYNSAFPAEERRERWYHLATMEREGFCFDAIFDSERFIGIVGWWSFEGITYIEHLATLPERRGAGYGAQILRLFMQEISQSSRDIILLEVEHPEDELSRRRIEFYRRAGFVLNPHHYEHPPYIGDSCVQLAIMTYPRSITQGELREFMDSYFPHIHFRHL